jgi:hippurate hydrolase
MTTHLLRTLALLAHLFPVALAARAGDIQEIVDSNYPDLERLYTDLHRNPELSLAEAKTAKRLADELRQAGYTVTENVGGHGVVAVLENGPGNVLMIRTDLDALPVKEETGVDYASTVTTTDPTGKTVNVMHACGHDVHITCLTGVARAMVQLKDRWKGTLVLIGQPAEEVGKGAKAMLDDGLFKRFPRPNYVLGLHVDPDLESGKVGYVPGYAMANVDSVDVVIRGVGGHGAYPHKTKDPIVISAQVILALQTIASREIRPIDSVVVTVGSIHGGTKHNIIPDEVAMQLTVRSYEDDVRDKTLKAIERITVGTAKAAGVPDDRLPTVTRRDPEFTPAVYNTPELVERVVGVFRGLVGEQNVVRRNPEMGGEDFSRYGREEPKVPIFMYRLGSVPPPRYAESKREGGRPLPSLHSAQYLPDRSPTIKTGVLTMTGAALDLLKPKE